MQGQFKIDNEYFTHIFNPSLKTPGLSQNRHEAR